jgi:hypothetical protein
VAILHYRQPPGWGKSFAGRDEGQAFVRFIMRRGAVLTSSPGTGDNFYKINLKIIFI